MKLFKKNFIFVVFTFSQLNKLFKKMRSKYPNSVAYATKTYLRNIKKMLKRLQTKVITGLRMLLP